MDRRRRQWGDGCRGHSGVVLPPRPQSWVEAGRTSHFVVVPASDTKEMEAWFSLGFGKQHIHALREPVWREFVPTLTPGLNRPPRNTRRFSRCSPSWTSHCPAHQAGSAVFSRQPIPTLEEALADLEEDFDNPSFATFVAERDGHVIGAAIGCSLELSPGHTPLMRPRSAGFLGYAAVLPGARGLGAGRALGETVMCWSRDEGYEWVATDWRSTNLNANRSWLALGFKPQFSPAPPRDRLGAGGLDNRASDSMGFRSCRFRDSQRFCQPRYWRHREQVFLEPAVRSGDQPQQALDLRRWTGDEAERLIDLDRVLADVRGSNVRGENGRRPARPTNARGPPAPCRPDPHKPPGRGRRSRRSAARLQPACLRPRLPPRAGRWRRPARSSEVIGRRAALGEPPRRVPRIAALATDDMREGLAHGPLAVSRITIQVRLFQTSQQTVEVPARR